MLKVNFCNDCLIFCKIVIIKLEFFLNIIKFFKYMYMNIVNRNIFNDLYNNLMCLFMGIMNKKNLYVCIFSLIF